MIRTLNTVAGAVGLLLILLILLSFIGSAAAADREAEKKIQEAREALNKAEYAEAARLFQATRELASEQEFVNSALYWEAFSRYRLQKTVELKIAAELLTRIDEDHADAESAAETAALASRIYGELAQRGEVAATREIHERASAEEMRLDTRVAALQALLRMDPERARPILEKIIRDDSPKNMELRKHAVMIACHEYDGEFHSLLLELLQTETDPEFLADVVMCLGNSSNEKVASNLMELYSRNISPHVNQAVILSIAHSSDEVGGRKVFDFLSTIARDQTADIELRQYALMALTRADQDELVLDLLLDILGSETDPDVLEFSVMSLAQLDNAKADQALQALINNKELDEEFKAQALFAASINGRIPVSFLRDVYLNAESRDLKLQVCHMLTRHEDEVAALDLLLELARAEKDPEIKQGMVFWMGNFDDPRAADFLLEILNEE